MKKACKLSGIFVLVAIIGFSMASCGGSGGGDPVSVDLSLPAITKVPAFDGTFVSSEAEAQILILGALEALDPREFANVLPVNRELDSMFSISRGLSRKIIDNSKNENNIEIIYENETLDSGGVANGFIKAGYNGSDTLEKKNDYIEVSGNAKLAIDFDDVPNSYQVKINGKYTFDGNVYAKGQITSVDPEEIKITLGLGVKNGYAISISHNGKGLKLILKFEAKFPTSSFTFNDLDESPSESDIFNIFNSKGTCILTYDVYDNNNEKKYSSTYNGIDEVSEFFGD